MTLQTVNTLFIMVKQKKCAIVNMKYIMRWGSFYHIEIN